MRVLVHCDNSYTNLTYISRKLKVLHKPRPTDDNVTENLNSIIMFYGYTYQKFRKAMKDINAKILLRYTTELSTCLKYVDAVILFHNFIEYNNGNDIIINMCLKHNIPLFLFSCHTRGCLTNVKGGDLVISNNYKELIKNVPLNMCRELDSNLKFLPLASVKIRNFDKTLGLMRSHYQELKEEKLEKSIRLI